ncbi:MAG: FAD binding domain-containing protein, partial [Nitrospinota bacterium]
MKNFEYLEPKTLKQASSMLLKYKRNARLLAGGTDLLVGLKGGWTKARYIINLKKVPGLDGLRFSQRQGLRFGALTTWHSLMSHPAVGEHYPILYEACRLVGSRQIRNVGTIGGNLCHASPAADAALPLLALDATCTIFGPRKERKVPVRELFAGPGRTSLKPGEILTEIQVPPPLKGAGSCFIKFSPRKAMDLAMVGVGAVMRVKGGRVEDVRIALGAVAPTPIRARRAEKVLLDGEPGEELISRAAEQAASECRPISDFRASGEYRREMV